jgi:hypothetical protein
MEWETRILTDVQMPVDTLSLVDPKNPATTPQSSMQPAELDAQEERLPATTFIYDQESVLSSSERATRRTMFAWVSCESSVHFLPKDRPHAEKAIRSSGPTATIMNFAESGVLTYTPTLKCDGGRS